MFDTLLLSVPYQIKQHIEDLARSHCVQYVILTLLRTTSQAVVN